MKTPVDRNDQPLSAYLLKILTTLVKKAGGEIKVDATDMLEESDGEGLSKRYDRVTKQLILTFVPAGSEIYFNAGDSCADATNPSSRMTTRPKSSSGIVSPLRQSDLTDNSTLSHEMSSLDYPSQSSRSGSTLDDARIADMEDHLRKEAAARIIANFPGTPVTEPRGQPANQRQSRRVQPSFFKG